MRIIYIPVTKKITEKNFQNYFKCFLYDIYLILKNFTFNRKISKGTSGYIDSAIHSNAYVLELPYYFCLFFSKILNFFFDAIFVNWKFTNFRKDKNDLEIKLSKISKKFKIKKVIVDATDKSTTTVNQDILNSFDYVIKREKNKSIIDKKYLTTMLPCRLINYKKKKKNEIINWSEIGKTKPNNYSKYDIFFSGQQSSKLRSDLIEFIKKQNFNFYGGIQNIKIPYPKYLETIYDSSINLALGGKGEFTFRHLEILACCSFMICESSINDLELPIPLKDGIHYVSFKKKKDLLEKIEYYLKNEKIRCEIALNGRKALEEYYSPKQHGNILFNKIFR